MSKGRDVNIGPHLYPEDRLKYGSQWLLLNQDRMEMLYPAVWNIAKIRTARVKLILEPDPFPAEALVEYQIQTDLETRLAGRFSGVASLCTAGIGFPNPRPFEPETGLDA